MSLGWPVAFAAATAVAAVGAGQSDSGSHLPVSLTVQNPPPQQLPQHPERFRAESIYVRVQVRVLDRRGEFVRDLHQGDFDILDEGVPQRLDSFVVVLTPGTSGDASVLHQATSATPDESNVVNADTRRVVLLLDDLHIASRRSIVVKRLIADFITTRLDATDRVALMTTSGLEPQVEFSVDHAALLEALQHFGGQKLPSAALQRMGSSGVLTGSDPQDADVRQRALNARRLLSTIQRVASRLGFVAAQPAAIVLVSEGPDYDTSAMVSNVPSDANDVIAAFHEAVRTCSDLGIPIHTVDPRGLVLPEGDAVEVHGEFNADVDFGLLNENSLSLRTLRNLAKFTGGTAVVERNDIAAGLARVAQEMGSYYLLGFYPSSPGRTRFHRLKVKVQRTGVRVVARAGYLMK